MQKDFDDRRHIDEEHRLRAELRDKSRAFSGLEYQLNIIAAKMMEDFDRARSIPHCGDRGAVRENFLRDFLKNGGYLPGRYAVSEGSSYVVSTTGHTSEQIDLLIYDALETPRLLDMNRVQYFPCESVYGVIQVKSDLSSGDDISEALENIASFKRLRRAVCAGEKMPYSGFGILFAYDARLKWKTLVKFVEAFVQNNPVAVWPNLVFVMQQGIIGNVLNGRVVFTNDKLSRILEPKLWPIPNAVPSLLEFYLILMDLLTHSHLPRVPLWAYASLPIPAEDLWYRFVPPSSELGHCAKHAQYLREIAPAVVRRIHNFCRTAAIVNGLEAIDEAYGTPGAMKNNYERQRTEVRIYNPDKKPYSEILISPEDKITPGLPRPLAFDAIVIADIHCWIPHFYSMRDQLIRECPDCLRSV